MKIGSKLRREDGAAAVEFALIVGVLALLIFGMLQFGVAFFSLQNLRAGTREGSRYGAVGATSDEVKTRVQDWTRVSGLTAAVVVEQQATAGTYTAVNGVTQPCAKVSGVQPLSVRTSVDLQSGSLPAVLQDVFVLDIPLMPSISLRGADVAGEFRCEGVS